MVWKQSNQNIENIEQIGDGLDFKSSAVDMRGWITGKMNIFTRKGNLEYETLFKTILKAYNHYHPERIDRIVLESWRGKDKIKLFVEPDRIIIIRHQRKDKGEEPKEVKTEVTKQEVNEVIICLNKLKEEYKNKIPTSRIAEYLYQKKWDSVFSNRPEHIRLTNILGILDYYGIIHYYRTGYSTILKNVREIQEVLKETQNYTQKKEI